MIKMSLILLICCIQAAVLSKNEEEVHFEDYHIKQRNIIEAQDVFEDNLQRAFLHPVTCQLATDEQERISFLRMNLETLKEKGRLVHCQKERPFTRAFTHKKQIAILDRIIKKKHSGRKLIKPLVPVVSAVPGEVLVSDIDIIADTGETAYDGVLLRTIKEREAIRTGPNDTLNLAPMLAGYEGVPLGIDITMDDTFASELYLRKAGLDPKTPFYYHTRDLARGLSFTNTQGLVSGVPAKAGDYSYHIEVGKIQMGMSAFPIFAGKVTHKIHPRPKHTVLDTSERIVFSGYSGVKFLNDGPALLKIKFTNGREGSVNAFTNIKNEKIYFETTLIKINETLGAVSSVSGQVGIRTGTEQWSIPFNGGGRRSALPRMKCTYRSGGTKCQKENFRDVKNGDVLMTAFDPLSGKIWFGINGVWKSDESDPALGFGADAIIKKPSGATEDFKKSLKIFVKGSNEETVQLNFGDQPWKYTPPNSYGGVLLPKLDSEKISNTWSSNSRTRGAIISTHSLSNKLKSHFSSAEMYYSGSGGDAVFAQNPKSRGRWQFEVEPHGYLDRVRVGIVPKNFDRFFRMPLGDIGSFGIAVGADKSDRFIIVNGEKYLMNGNISTSVRYTFDCNLDAKTLKIYANGELVFSGNLPEVPLTTEWTIAATSPAHGGAGLYTTLVGEQSGVMKYPIAEVKPWGLIAE